MPMPPRPSIPTGLKCFIPVTFVATALCLNQVLHSRIAEQQPRRILFHFIAAIASYIVALVSFSAAARQITHTRDSDAKPRKDNGPRHSVQVTRILGLCAATQVLSLPKLVSPEPLRQVLLRVTCFFYACKLLDLTLRARNPPVLLRQDNAYRSRTIEYVYRLLTEMRYRSFDIHVVVKGRNGPPSKRAHYGPPLLVLPIAYLVPRAETYTLVGLVVIQSGLETLHTILHPRCPDRLFWQPLAAPSASAFWATHWQQSAKPWLTSLGYLPVYRLATRLAGEKVGKALGVLATFSLSGVWHGWCAAALSTNPWRTAVGLWTCFVLSGALCVIESVMHRHRNGRLSTFQLVIVWGLTLLSVGTWVRDSIPRSRLPMPQGLWFEGLT